MSGSYGGTQVASQIIGFEVNGVKTGLVPQFTMDGTLYFTKVLSVDPDITGKITFLHDSATNGASGEKSRRSETPRLIQIVIEGSTFTNVGTTYSKKTFMVNLPVKGTKFGAWENKRWRDHLRR